MKRRASFEISTKACTLLSGRKSIKGRTSYNRPDKSWLRFIFQCWTLTCLFIDSHLWCIKVAGLGQILGSCYEGITRYLFSTVMSLCVPSRLLYSSIGSPPGNSSSCPWQVFVLGLASEFKPRPTLRFAHTGYEPGHHLALHRFRLHGMPVDEIWIVRSYDETSKLHSDQKSHFSTSRTLVGRFPTTHTNARQVN